MFRGVLRVLLILVALVCCVLDGADAIRTSEKRHVTEGGYQMCLESFDIHKDKIIKTQDSREMGAKYLSVMDVDSELDCLKYCCNTERCDVFIFEEKKPGSCYLFQCGPLHDFKCKFTRHANYTSAVRTTYPTQEIHEEEIRISQQEHELKSLRKNSDIISDYGFTEAPVKVVITQIPKVISTTSAPIKPACSRNQYECRSSGDCIAIYNVCDGIPQCADGSDEAADLTCPTEKPVVAVPPVIQAPRDPPPDVLRYQQIIDDQKPPFSSFYPGASEINPKSWEMPANAVRQMSQPQNNMLYPGQSMEMQMQMRKNYGSPGYQWDYQPLYEQSKEPYVPANSFHETNLNPYEQQPRIFNHKGTSVLENGEADRGLYMDSKHPYASHFPSLNKGAWQENQALLPPSAPSVINSEQKQVESNAENVVKTTTTPICETSESHKVESAQHQEADKKEQKVDTDLAKHASKQVTEKPSLPASAVTKHSHLKEVKERKSSVIVIEEHARARERTDIISERVQIIENDPKGAVVSLTLGLIATVIAVFLISCGFSVARRRRGRCGHGPYAHDADYLVNGMYL